MEDFDFGQHVPLDIEGVMRTLAGFLVSEDLTTRAQGIGGLMTLTRRLQDDWQTDFAAMKAREGRDAERRGERVIYIHGRPFRDPGNDPVDDPVTQTPPEGHP